jgi:hypothetical protein
LTALLDIAENAEKFPGALPAGRDHRGYRDPKGNQGGIRQEKNLAEIVINRTGNVTNQTKDRFKKMASNQRGKNLEKI